MHTDKMDAQGGQCKRRGSSGAAPACRHAAAGLSPHRCRCSHERKLRSHGVDAQVQLPGGRQLQGGGSAGG